MLSADDIRRLALELPEVVESGHHGRPSFRVRGRIFATLWTPTRLNVMLDQGEIAAAVQEAPEVCSAFQWGGVPRAVQVDLEGAASELVQALLEEGWARAAPRAVRRAHLQR